jgi:hypothetical protein
MARLIHLTSGHYTLVGDVGTRGTLSPPRLSTPGGTGGPRDRPVFGPSYLENPFSN